jgi:DNA-binding GntR family transcriptional regulator
MNSPFKEPAMVAFPQPAATPTTLKLYVFHQLREAIVTGKWRPGDRLNESQIAREFGISRIPVREALLQLQEHGLVMNHERRGMFVTRLDESEVQRINSVRLVLEAEALKLCRAKITREEAAQLTHLVEMMEAWTEGTEMDAAVLDLSFHRTLWAATGNPYLTRTLDSLTTVLFAHKALEIASIELTRWRLHHHRELLDVVLGRSDLTPETAILSHLRSGYKDPESYSSLAAAGQEEQSNRNS